MPVIKYRTGLAESETDWNSSEFESSDGQEDLDELEQNMNGFKWPPDDFFADFDKECVLERRDCTAEMFLEHERKEQCLPCHRAAVDKDKAKLKEQKDPFEGCHPSVIPAGMRTPAQRRQLRAEKAAKIKEAELQLVRAEEEAKRLAEAAVLMEKGEGEGGDGKDTASSKVHTTEDTNTTVTPSSTKTDSNLEGLAKKGFDWKQRQDQINAFAREKGIGSGKEAKRLFIAEERRAKSKAYKEQIIKEKKEVVGDVPKGRQAWLPFTKYPLYPNRMSVMTREEHERFVGMMANFMQYGRFKFENQGPEFKEMKERLSKEHDHFVQFVREKTEEDFDKHPPCQRRVQGVNPLFNFLPKQYDLFVQRRLEHLAEQLRTDILLKAVIPDAYVPLKHIAPFPNPQIVSGPNVIDISQILLEIGKCGKIVLPDLKVKAQVETGSHVVERGYPADQAKMFDESVQSTDETCKQLATKFDIDMVLPASTARMLIAGGTPGRGANFDIPLQIVQYVSAGHVHSRLHFLKALPPRSQTVVQRLWTFYKYALRTKLVHKKFDAEKAHSYSSQKQQDDDPFGMPYDPMVESLDPVPVVTKKRKLVIESDEESGKEGEEKGENKNDEKEKEEGKEDGKFAEFVEICTADEKEEEGQGPVTRTLRSRGAKASAEEAESKPAEKVENAPEEANDQDIGDKIEEEIEKAKPKRGRGRPKAKSPRQSVTPTAAIRHKTDSPGQKIDSQGQKMDSAGQKTDSVGQKQDSVGQKKGTYSPVSLDVSMMNLMVKKPELFVGCVTPRLTRAFKKGFNERAGASRSPEKTGPSQEEKKEESGRKGKGRGGRRERVEGKKGREGVADVLDAIIGKDTNKTHAQAVMQKEMLENPAKYDAPTKPGLQYIYGQWSLGEHSLLVRAKSHGQMKSARMGDRQVNASVVPKIEYIPEHGAQELSDVEWLYQWTTWKLQQSKEHVTARIHFINANLLALQQQNFTAINNQREQLLKQRMMWVNKLFTELKQLDPGNYLLRHTPEGKVIIFRQSDGTAGGGINVCEAYDTGNEWVGALAPLPHFNALYLPPSPDVLLQWHKIRKTIPCAFPFKKEGCSPNLTGSRAEGKHRAKNHRKAQRKRQGKERAARQEDSDSD